MKDLEQKAILCRFLYRKLEEIEKEYAFGFSNSEKYFIKYLCLLYKISEEHGDYFAKKYKILINRKADRVSYDMLRGSKD